MKKENPVLVLASGYDPQFAMLNELPHTVCEEVAACTQAGKDATVILLWSGTRELLRSFDPILEGFRKTLPDRRLIPACPVIQQRRVMPYCCNFRPPLPRFMRRPITLNQRR